MPKRPAGLIDPPDDLTPNRRAAAQRSGVLSRVPYGVQMVGEFSDAGNSSASASITRSPYSKSKRQKDPAILHPGINTAQDPDKTHVRPAGKKK